ncbi:MAG: hypothetical protein MZV70_53720, partial [Desulfobacterales bacterium]|nr:hypothetical protein [Desulfobacterales bacterium]
MRSAAWARIGAPLQSLRQGDHSDQRRHGHSQPRRCIRRPGAGAVRRGGRGPEHPRRGAWPLPRRRRRPTIRRYRWHRQRRERTAAPDWECANRPVPTLPARRRRPRQAPVRGQRADVGNFSAANFMGDTAERPYPS